MEGADFARTVTPAEPIEFDGDGPHVVGIDTGIKLSIIRQLRERGCRRDAAALRHEPRGRPRPRPRPRLPRQRPRRPRRARLRRRARPRAGRQEARSFGICLGHQLLCRAVGLETFKLPFGHRGANHPVKDLATGRIDITSQNHGFAVAGPGRREHDRGRRAGPLGDRLRRGRALPPQPLRPHGRGPRAEGRPRRHRPVPPRGRPRPARRPLPLRPLPGAGARGGA